MTQLSQAIKGLAVDPPLEGDAPDRLEDCLRELRRAKAYLWHGSPHRALRTLEDLSWDIARPVMTSCRLSTSVCWPFR